MCRWRMRPLKRRLRTQAFANLTLPVGTTLRRQYNGPVITLSENEERLVEALRGLPPDAVDQVMTWTIRLHDLANGKTVDWSDMWTEEGLADVPRVLVQI